MLTIKYRQNYLIFFTMATSSILITGASGLIGSRLTEMLVQKGHAVSHVGRSAKSKKVPSFLWDVKAQKIDGQALKNIDTIIHLAGAGIADKRWSPSRKNEIIESRVGSTRLLANALSTQENSIKNFISASAIGYYGFGSGREVFTEDSKPGNDFLANVTKTWEAEVDKLAFFNLRIAKLRIGIVLSEKGGALKSMVVPVKWFIGSPLGTGYQQVSWIHIDDVCRMFIHLVENEGISGAFNATGPYAVSNTELIHAIAHALQRPVFLPKVPGFILKIIVGEMADMILKGNTVSSKKILDTGFEFKFATLEAALNDLLQPKN
jgi:uncharacterized protein